MVWTTTSKRRRRDRWTPSSTSTTSTTMASGWKHHSFHCSLTTAVVLSLLISTTTVIAESATTPQPPKIPPPPPLRNLKPNIRDNHVTADQSKIPPPPPPRLHQREEDSSVQYPRGHNPKIPPPPPPKRTVNPPAGETPLPSKDHKKVTTKSDMIPPPPPSRQDKEAVFDTDKESKTMDYVPSNTTLNGTPHQAPENKSSNLLRQEEKRIQEEEEEEVGGDDIQNESSLKETNEKDAVSDEPEERSLTRYTGPQGNPYSPGSGGNKPPSTRRWQTRPPPPPLRQTTTEGQEVETEKEQSTLINSGPTYKPEIDAVDHQRQLMETSENERLGTSQERKISPPIKGNMRPENIPDRSIHSQYSKDGYNPPRSYPEQTGTKGFQSANRLPHSQGVQSNQYRSHRFEVRPQPSTGYSPSRTPIQPPRSRASQPSLVTSTWKSLWGRVEKGLDNLADLEDTLAGKTQQLLSTVKSSPKERQEPKTTIDTRRWSTQERKAKVSTPVKTPLAPYGNKYEIAKKKEQLKKSTGGSRQVNWNEMTTGKLIRANGGASSPDGQHPSPPAMPLQRPAYKPPADAVKSNAPGGGDEQEPQKQPQQYVQNPYLQSGELKVPEKKSSALSDPHARSNRIPWDPSTSTGKMNVERRTPQVLARKPTNDDDSYGKSSILSTLNNIRFPRIPNPAKLFRFGGKSASYSYANIDAWKDDEDEAETGGFFGLFKRKKNESLVLTPSRPSVKNGDALAAPLQSMLDRCDNGKTLSLLSVKEDQRCRRIGRYQAFFDGLSVLFVLIGLQQTGGFGGIPLPRNMDGWVHQALPVFGIILRDSLSTWAPLFFGYAYLALYAKRTLLNAKVVQQADLVGSIVEEESQYAQLYLRLAAAIRMDPNLPSRMKQVAAAQVQSLVATVRLNTFIALVLGTLVVMTVTVIGPVLAAIGHSILQLFQLEEIRSWPIAWQALGSRIQQIFQALALTLKGVLASGMTAIFDDPIKFAFHISIFVSALLISLIPRIEANRKVSVEKDDDEDALLMSGESAQQFAKLGSSSATRLTLLSENGSIEIALERWKTLPSVVEENFNGSLGLTFRRFLYKFIVAVVVALPIVVSYLVGMTSMQGIAHIGIKWDSIMDVSIVLVGLFLVTSNAVENVVVNTQAKGAVKSFLKTMTTTLEELRDSNRRRAEIQFMASVSATAGLVVKDLWAAHTTKRAWAVRGANFQCKNGEILAILGDDGAGKTRMLTAIAETLIAPPRRSLTSNKVRGFVGIGGVESSKWDKSVLKRRMGVLLSDVRSVADTANLCSGCSLEEILEPVDGIRGEAFDHKLSSSGKSSILLALKMTGLYTTLMPKLPLKLSTVLTANEEDLKPSALRPRSQVLSPAEWSKLILAKVLAQTIYDNDNAAASTDKIDNCLVGSVLLLDEPTVLLSEVEEAKILKDLRQSGAATVIASNKWATGRFADHIVVVRDGAIIESGSHNELIARGPQQSLYAAKWYAMTTG